MSNGKNIFALAMSIVMIGCSGESSTETDAVNDANLPDPLGGESVAVVDSSPIPLALLERLSLDIAQRNASALTDEQRAQLIERLVFMRLLADDAIEQNLPAERQLATELEYARLQLLARAATEHFRAQNEPTEAELRAAYEENLPRYLATQHKARHILVPTEEQAIAIIEELDNGADFAELAREHSTGPTGPQGGDLGWFTADSMVEPFAEAVRAATIGVYTSTPVQTQFGWHVILVEDVREQQPPGLEAVRDELIGIVERSKLDGYIEALREEATIAVN